MKNSGRSAAFLKKMSDIGEQEYAWLVIASIAHGGHHWANSDDQANPPDIHTKP